MADLGNTGSVDVSQRVMVIDDDEFQLELTSDMLSSLGFSDILTAMSGQDALNQYDKAVSKPGLLICDLFMPEMDGFDFMTHLSKRKYSGSLLIVSGQEQRVRRSASLVAQLSTCNFLGEIEKPINRVLLKSMLTKA